MMVPGPAQSPDHLADLQQDLHDMPVVSEDGKLVGVASRVDIGTTILSAWSKVE